MSNLPTEIAFTSVACCVCCAAAFTDLRRSVIPNPLTLPLLALAPLVHFTLGGPGALGLALLGIVACGAVPMLAFRRGGMGGGDVKLLAALGGLLGAERGLAVELVALCIAALQATWLLIRHGKLARSQTFPLAPAIALAAFVVLLWPELAP
jgi:prepilin peptidase CpaA